MWAGQLTSAGPSNLQERRSRPGSRSSLGVRKRNGSIASSKRSGPNQEILAVTGPQPTTTAVITAASSPNKQRKRGISKFLSFLNCCSAQEDAQDIDLVESTNPVRKPNKLQQTQIRHPAPSTKADVSAAESSTAESKEMSDEKIGGTPYTDLRSAAEPMAHRRAELAAPMPIPDNSGPAEIPKAEKSVDVLENVSSGQPSSAVQIEAPTAESRLENSKDGGLEPQPSSILIQPPTPTVPNQDDNPDHRTAIQEKRDSDVEMTEASPVLPVTDDSAGGTGDREAETTQPLPPPPPRTDTHIRGHDRNVSNSSNVPSEQQKWLLPPIRAEFKGKKCLVLDLDETLVHSSFKVTYFRKLVSDILLKNDRCYIKRISPYPWRSKVSITTFM